MIVAVTIPVAVAVAVAVVAPPPPRPPVGESFGSNTSRKSSGADEPRGSVVEVVVGGGEDLEDRGLVLAVDRAPASRLRSRSRSKPDVFMPPQL